MYRAFGALLPSRAGVYWGRAGPLVGPLRNRLGLGPDLYNRCLAPLVSTRFRKEFALALVAFGWGLEKLFAKPVGPKAEFVKPMSGRPWPDHLLQKTRPGNCKAHKNWKEFIFDSLFLRRPRSAGVVFLLI